jgi:acetyl-CoA C-acetyltransferase
VPGAQLNRVCASGLDAFNAAAAKVASGWEDLVCAGGYERMSRVPNTNAPWMMIGARATDFLLKTRS